MRLMKESGFSRPRPEQHVTATSRGTSGIVLAIVLVLIFVLVTAVYAFQRRAIIDTSIAVNRLRSAEAEALARGGLRIGEAVVFLAHLKDAGGSLTTPPGAAALAPGTNDFSPEDLWANMGAFPLELEDGRTLRVSIEDENTRLNLNALVDPNNESESNRDDEEAEEYLVEVLKYIVDGIDAAETTKKYDTREIARNLLDYMDADETARNGRDEDGYYRSQDPPYQARNGPFLSFGEIGLVEGIDAHLLDAMRDYMTIYPIGSTRGINLNRAEPWVLSIVYSGTSGERELIRKQTVQDIWALRAESKILCDDTAQDPARCVSIGELGNGSLGEGSIYPETPLPAKPSVFRVVAEASVGQVTRRIEAIYDTRPKAAPQLLSWRRLRGSDS